MEHIRELTDRLSGLSIATDSVIERKGRFWVPLEIWLIVFEYLDKTIVQCLFVSRMFNLAAEKLLDFKLEFDYRRECIAHLTCDPTRRFYGAKARKIVSRPGWVHECEVELLPGDDWASVEIACEAKPSLLVLNFKYAMGHTNIDDLLRLRCILRCHKPHILRVVDVHSPTPGTYRMLQALHPLADRLEYKLDFTEVTPLGLFAQVSKYAVSMYWHTQTTISEAQEYIDLCSNLSQLTLSEYPEAQDAPLVLPCTVRSLTLSVSARLDGMAIVAPGCNSVLCHNTALTEVKFDMPQLRDLTVVFYTGSGPVSAEEVAGAQSLCANGMARLAIALPQYRDPTPLSGIISRVRQEVVLMGESAPAAVLCGLQFSCQRIRCEIPFDPALSPQDGNIASSRVTAEVVSSWIRNSTPDLCAISLAPWTPKSPLYHGGCRTIMASEFAYYRALGGPPPKPPVAGGQPPDPR